MCSPIIEKLSLDDDSCSAIDTISILGFSDGISSVITIPSPPPPIYNKGYTHDVNTIYFSCTESEISYEKNELTLTTSESSVSIKNIEFLGIVYDDIEPNI